MHFSSSRRSNISSSAQNTPPPPPQMMAFSSSYRNYKMREEIEKHNQRIATPAPQPNIINQVIKEDRPKTMKWGQPTWFFLHTMAHKVKPEYFPQIRREFLDIILKICNNLPCPDCATHATRYMQGVNFDTIVTKQHLIDLLFRFHNSVNIRKSYAQFDYSDLHAKYSSAITINIIHNFIQHFEQRMYSARVSAHNFHRGLAIVQIKQWLKTNIQCFD